METLEMTLQRNLEIAKHVCDSVNIPYREIVSTKVNKRAKSRWGMCRYVGKEQFEIEISDRLLQPGVSNKALMDTLLHEILHTCKDCMNHGKVWKMYARRLNEIGYDIKCTASAAEKNIKEEPVIRRYRYTVTCERCGHVYKYQRRGSVVQSLQRGSTRCYCSCGCNKLTLREL